MVAKKEVTVVTASNESVPQPALESATVLSPQNQEGDRGGKEVDTKKANRRPKPPKRFVKYEVIGNNNVAVPTHLFKVY